MSGQLIITVPAQTQRAGLMPHRGQLMVMVLTVRPLAAALLLHQPVLQPIDATSSPDHPLISKEDLQPLVISQRLVRWRHRAAREPCHAFWLHLYQHAPVCKYGHQFRAGAQQHDTHSARDFRC